MAYVFPNGPHIRVDIASADFQNAWPVRKQVGAKICRGGRSTSHAIVPIAPAQDPKPPPPEFKPPPRPAPTLTDLNDVEYEISRDVVNETVTVSLTSTSAGNDNDRRQSQRQVSSSDTESKANPADA